jgi:tRNA/tmRNA/rRNA uracil-C5-methylase (TrmA/RlmC/RlmD family)
MVMKTETEKVEIIDYTAEGAGVARLANGRVVFIEGAVRGDICEIAVTKALSRVCFGKIVKIISPSEHRIQTDCPVFGRCGGCDFRHITYGEELFAKRKRVNDALRRIGGVSIEIETLLTTGKINGYRNNVQLKSDGKKIGFYAKNSHEIVEVDKCLLIPEQINIHEQNCTKIRTITETIGDLTFRISPESFFQVNTEAALLLFEKAREYAALQPHETLLDLYCGTGTITLFLARDAARAIGVEVNSAAVENARENAALNNIHNADFVCADVATIDLNDFNPDCVVVDPPRRGLDSVSLQSIADLRPPRIVYVSCDPATLARDIKAFAGYEVARVCAVDMFPRTRHVECVGLLRRSV